MRPELRIPIPSRRVGILASLLAVAMGVVLIGAGNTDAFGAAAGTAFTPCLPGTEAATVTYARDGVETLRGAGLSALTVSGLDRAGCDGATVVLVVSGNPAGDPTGPVTETLATYDSRLDPCTQQTLTHPAVIRGGSITLHGCPTGGPAADANLHDATHLQLTVRGSTLPTSVLGETITKPGPATTVKSAVRTGAELPFTGTYAALSIWLGLILVAGGLSLVLLGRRRRAGSSAVD